jgi:hypothetical protein
LDPIGTNSASITEQNGCSLNSGFVPFQQGLDYCSGIVSTPVIESNSCFQFLSFYYNIYRVENTGFYLQPGNSSWPSYSFAGECQAPLPPNFTCYSVGYFIGEGFPIPVITVGTVSLTVTDYSTGTVDGMSANIYMVDGGQSPDYAQAQMIINLKVI